MGMAGFGLRATLLTSEEVNRENVNPSLRKLASVLIDRRRQSMTHSRATRREDGSDREPCSHLPVWPWQVLPFSRTEFPALYQLTSHGSVNSVDLLTFSSIRWHLTAPAGWACCLCGGSAGGKERGGPSLGQSSLPSGFWEQLQASRHSLELPGSGVSHQTGPGLPLLTLPCGR